MDYIEFLGDVFLFRTVRDTDNLPEIWMDRWLDNLACDSDLTADQRQQLMLATKMAELIDDRKSWLLEEIEVDLQKLVTL